VADFIATLVREGALVNVISKVPSETFETRWEESLPADRLPEAIRQVQDALHDAPNARIMIEVWRPHSEAFAGFRKPDGSWFWRE